MRRGPIRRAWLLGPWLLALPALAAGPVLHEYFDPSPEEDLALGATTAHGQLSAAIDTSSGVVAAPDPSRRPLGSEQAYGGRSTPESPDARYLIDRNTTRPDLVAYDDPFIPAVTPFKRLYAYDSVTESLELGVADKSLTEMPSSGPGLGPTEDGFYADMVVDLAADTPVRIPSVGPGARVISAVIEPKAPFVLLRDGADNWFVKSPAQRRARLVMELGIDRAVFGSEFAEVRRSDLAAHLPSLPSSVEDEADRVLSEIGISATTAPRAALALLVRYFRAFSPSEELPEAEQGAALYLELALSRKGVCRHRAYAFVISAIRAGLPARMVRNEAHAWVEVYDGVLWHRIDLGGAAGRLEMRQDQPKPLHQPPQDPFEWPEGSNSGLGLGLENAASSGQAPGDGASGVSSGGDATPASSPALPPAPSSTSDDRPPSELSFRVDRAVVRRGESVRISGRVEAGGAPCALSRVDVGLRDGSGSSVPLAPLPAGEDGRFSGDVVIPLSEVDVGDYQLFVSTPGTARCGPGRQE